MTRPATLVIVAGVAGLVAGWPALASAQRVAPRASSAEAQPRQDPQQRARTTQEERQPDATVQTTDAQAGRGPTEPRTPIPPITDADRAAAFPDVEGHRLRDNAVHAFVLADHVEWQGVDGSGLSWDTKGWVGRDRDRFWFRAEGESDDGRLDGAEAHFLYGRAFARWWDVVVGVRQDLRPGPAQTWAAFGVQGLAPYWFDVEATAYIGDGGQTAARLEAEYELLLTNRLIVQPLVEVNLYGRANPERGISAGVSTVETGVRVRYELRREFAPYVGVVWTNAFSRTADIAATSGEQTDGPRLVVGLRLWF